MSILIPGAVIGGLGLIFGLLLGFAAKVFEVKTDPRIEKITEELPGANCGGCGYAVCAAYAEAIVKDGAPTTSCGAGGSKTATKIAEIMGVKGGEFVRKAARVMCAGNCEASKTKYVYSGISDCVAAARVGEGQKECIYGCLGFGTCVSACESGALSIVNGVAHVEREKCTSCGKCVLRCPKQLIKMTPFENSTIVACNNKEKGAIARNVCDVSCIGCGLCARSCPSSAIEIKDFLAVIDYDKCCDCGLCEEKCVRKAIRRV